MPGADWEPIPEAETAPAIDGPIQVIFHSAVGKGDLHDYFARPDIVVESHFWVALDGRIAQYVPTTRRADANLDANRFAISVESEDNGDPDNFPWTDAQLDSHAEIVRWANGEYGIPIRPCPAWNEPGIGYHTMWGAPSHWTPVEKTCPGRARIAQFPEILRRAETVALTAADANLVVDTLLSRQISTGWHEAGGFFPNEPEPVTVAACWTGGRGAALSVYHGKATELATQLIAALVPAIVAALPPDTTGLARAEIEAACHSAVTDVFIHGAAPGTPVV